MARPCGLTEASCDRFSNTFRDRFEGRRVKAHIDGATVVDRCSVDVIHLASRRTIPPAQLDPVAIQRFEQVSNPSPASSGSCLNWSFIFCSLRGERNEKR